MKYHTDECRQAWTERAIVLSNACDFTPGQRPDSEAVDRFLAFIRRTHMMDRAERCRMCGTALQAKGA